MQRLARNLAEDHIVGSEISDDYSGPAFRIGEVRKWERDDDNVADYKSFHAESSSGVSQSLARADSARSMGADRSS